jgi:hypothetical protein
MHSAERTPDTFENPFVDVTGVFRDQMVCDTSTVIQRQHGSISRAGIKLDRFRRSEDVGECRDLQG